jgi:hypothetical protein
MRMRRPDRQWCCSFNRKNEEVAHNECESQVKKKRQQNKELIEYQLQVGREVPKGIQLGVNKRIMDWSFQVCV